MNIGYILVIAAIVGAVITGYCIHRNTREATYCGTIKYKVDAVQWSKHSGHAQPLFVIDFGDRGIEEIEPTWNDYRSHDEGDRICYSILTKDAKEFSHGYALIGFLLIAGALVGAIGYSLEVDHEDSYEYDDD